MKGFTFDPSRLDRPEMVPDREVGKPLRDFLGGEPLEELRLMERHEAWRRAGIPEREIYCRLAAERGVAPEQIEAKLHDGDAPAPSPYDR